MDDVPRINVYVDGFNLYHGCFDDASRPGWRDHRWLDLACLSNQLIKHAATDPEIAVVTPDATRHRIRYFTSKAKKIKNDPQITDATVQRQDVYWRALRTISMLEIHQGKFYAHRKQRYLAASSGLGFGNPHTKVNVILREEKGSDVNLASHLLVDASRGEFDIAIVVTNDSDLAEPIRLVRSEFGRSVVIANPRQTYANDLQNCADGYLLLHEDMLRTCQFPDSLHDTNGVFRRPDTWQPTRQAEADAGQESIPPES